MSVQKRNTKIFIAQKRLERVRSGFREKPFKKKKKNVSNIQYQVIHVDSLFGKFETKNLIEFH